MARKSRFPLDMADGAQVRNLEELKEHFDLETVLGYYKNQKLLTWLRDRYFDDEAAAVEELDETAPDLQQKLCEIFGVAYTGETVDMEEISRRQERLEKLRAFTDEAEVIDHIDQVAFDQEELADLLDEAETMIYLCGKKFTVPASRKGVKYIGVNSPSVHIGGKLPKNMEELGIEIVGCNVDNLMQTHNSENISDADKYPDITTLGFEEITLSDPIHIAKGKTCSYKNKIIHFQASMECEGTLEFDSCILHYGEIPGTGYIHMAETAALSVCQCTIEAHSYERRMFIEADGIKTDFVFDRCKFLNCCSFFQKTDCSKNDKQILLKKCKIINPGTRFFCDRPSYSESQAFDITECKFSFLAPPAFVIEAYEDKKGEIICGDKIHLSMSSVIGDIQLQCSQEANDVKSNIPRIFSGKYIKIDRSSFYGVSEVIEGDGNIILSTFEHCLEIFSMRKIIVKDCRFDNCTSVASLGEGSQFNNCQFNNCFGTLLDTTYDGGVSITFCEFNNWIAFESCDGNAMLEFSRSDDYGACNTVKNCAFNGMKANKCFLILGKCTEWPTSKTVIQVEKCSFTNCTSMRESQKLIREYNLQYGWFNTQYSVRTTYIGDCTGLDKVNTGIDHNDHIELKTKTSGGIAIGAPNK